jgi:hypothetical protein
MHKLALHSFEIQEIGVHDDTELLLAQTASLGPSMALSEQPSWMAVCIGKFEAPQENVRKDASIGRVSVRLCVAHPSAKRVSNVVGESIKASLKNSVAGIQFRETPDPTDWLQPIADHEVGCVDITGHVPRLSPTSSRSNVLWMSRFIDELSQFESPCGVVILLRPFSDSENPGQSALVELRRYFENASVTRKGETKQNSNRQQEVERKHNSKDFSEEKLKRKSKRETKENRKGERGKQNERSESEQGIETKKTDERQKEAHGSTSTEETTESTEYQSSLSTTGGQRSETMRRKALAILDEYIRSGAWWVGIRTFGANAAIARKVASVYWASVANIGEGDSRGVSVRQTSFLSA